MYFVGLFVCIHVFMYVRVYVYTVIACIYMYIVIAYIIDMCVHTNTSGRLRLRCIAKGRGNEALSN
jgi:hypothetical protein